MEEMLILCIKQIWGYISYLQSLWLTSWFGYNNNKGYSNSNRNSNRSRHIANAVDAGVYTLQQPHKFPLQLDVYSGNCSFDYQQHEPPSGHYQNQQQQQQGEHKLHSTTASTASTAQAQSTLSVEQLKLKLTKTTSGGEEEHRFLRNSTQIYETKFIESSAGQKMDDMVYQCSNQNSIYVLNAGYNPSYGDFGTHAMHTQMTATGREMNGSRTTRTRNSIGASCSSAACSLQHKFKSFGTAAAASNGNSSAMPSSAATATATATATAIATTAATMATTIIAATATPTASTALAAAATPAATTTTTITANYVNPVATSMSTAAMCSPATAALQKLFNCNVVVGGGGGGNVCQNVSHRNHHQQQQQQQQQQHQGNHIGNGSNNNCPVGSHNNSCLSTTSSSHRSICDPHEGSAGVGVGVGVGAGALPSMANKKKCTNVKSTLIAKKTKFLKFLEEEKWRSSNNIAQLAAQDAEACGAPLALLPSSNEAEPYAASRTTSAMAATSSLAAHSGIKQNNNNSTGEELAGAEQQQNKLNNWSMHNDSNNKLTNYKQQQQLEMNKQTAKSSYELYQEAADILGLSCSLCDNCRCLDCQSGYFDCADDDDESYSEQSLMDEYDEYDYHGYGYEQEQEHEQQASPLLTSAHHAGPNQPAMTQPDQHQLHHQQQPQQQQLQAPELNLCYAVDCHQNCIRSDDGQTKEGTFQTDSDYDYVYEKDRETEVEAEAESGPNTATKSEHRLAIDFDLINATSSQVLQNCATFNDLSLLERQVEPFT
ncbi:homeobox protein prospero [Drosophila albomicans]|uniref:Homeobox protein prospero n=1 Tax=Drosophila albomicans TaxID=7291 RepID=A0A9C6T578_DROAB|nr:homeobox protein prospero [Drosophila albomicans]